MDFDKQKLNLSFQKLRKMGFMARQNFLCCSSCAGCQATHDMERQLKAGKTVKGLVYYHRQDAEVLQTEWHERGWRRWRRGEELRLMIRYSNFDSTEYGEIGLPTHEIGDIVANTFREVGIPFDWDGNPDHCIEVIVKKGKEDIA